MKILFCNIFKSYNGDIIASKMKALGYDVIEKTYFTPEGKEQEDLLVEKVFYDIKSIDPEVIFTVNVWIAVAKACHDADRSYVAWSYDSPINVEICEELKYKTNHIYLFDRAEVNKLKALGVDTVEHMPLAVDTDYWDKFDGSSFGKCDISFLGSLYHSTLKSFSGALSEYNQGYLESIVNTLQKVYGFNLVDELLTDEIIQSFYKDFTQYDENFKPSKAQLSYSIFTQVTYLDRVTLIKVLSDRYNFSLVTKDIDDAERQLLNTTNIFNPVDYNKGMADVFKASKINLNPVFRGIQSGIPLRALDIMGCGGFLLSSYQEEYLDYFDNENDIVLYDSLEDAVAKADFYLKNDSIREQIARNGYERVKLCFGYEDRLEHMLKF